MNQPKDDRLTPVLVTALLVLLNTVAIYGQAHWFYDHIARTWIVAASVAAVIELIGVYLAHMTHKFLMADQSPGSTRLGSYAVGILAGVLNYAHWRGVAGVTFGILSALSPYLWSVWSRYRNRQRLADLGMTDVRGLKLSPVRKMLHPVKSYRLVRWAAWEGVTDVETARQAWELEQALGNAEMPTSVSGIPMGNSDAELDHKRRIVAQAHKIKSEGGSWGSAAKQLDVSERTLYNYRREVGCAD